MHATKHISSLEGARRLSSVGRSRPPAGNGRKCYATQLLYGTSANTRGYPYTSPSSTTDDAVLDHRILFPKYHKLKVTQQGMYPDQDRVLDRLSESRAIGRAGIEERLSAIFALLQTGETYRAETIFNRALRSNPNDMKDLVDVRVVNAFIEAHLECKKEANIARALNWYETLTDLEITPNHITFAMFIRYYLRVGALEDVAKMINQMEALGIPVGDVVGSERFAEREDRSALEAVLRSMGKDLHSLATADQLLLSALGESASAPHSESDIRSEEAAKSKTIARKLNPTAAAGVGIIQKALRDMEKHGHASKFDQQLWLEERSFAAALEMSEDKARSLPKHLQVIAHNPTDITLEWNKVLVPLIDREVRGLSRAAKDAEKYLFLPFLKLLSPGQLSRITITEFLRPRVKSSESTTVGGHITVTQLTMAIGKAVEAEYNARKMREKNTRQKIKLDKGIHKLHSDGKLYNLTIRKIISKISQKHLSTELDWIPVWPDAVRVQLGGFLSKLLIEVAKVRIRKPDAEHPEEFVVVDEPAFTRTNMRTGKGFKLAGVIRYHPALYDLLINRNIHIDAWRLPMLIPPKPWVSSTSGGYITTRSRMVRLYQNRLGQEYLRAADKAENLDQVARALDVLGSVPWVINESIYEVAAHMWNNNEHAVGLPAPVHFPVPIKPDDYGTNDKARMQYHKELRRREQKLAENFSQRVDANYKLEIARAFVGETMYFPHNVDFRGRAYPMPVHLNHIGNDLCRGLLLFQHGKPLGERGLQWLKIQIASLAGYDKASFRRREQYTDDHREDVFDSADHPLDGRRWWLKAEKPWELLAACMEFTRAIRSPNPAEYICRLPIHQDGTCNGLQHYAALGGDEAGARHVNLLPSDKPEDVYSGVATKVQEIVNKDAEASVPEAIIMKERINRKLVKQTVMTNTYGVTLIGAREQVRNRLKEARAAALVKQQTHGPESLALLERPLSDEEIQRCSRYVTALIFQAMGQLFEGARAIQNWLNATAGMIARSTPVEQIPRQQLDDAAQLSRMGVLPHPFTVARTARVQADEASNTLLSALEEDNKEILVDEGFSTLEDELSAMSLDDLEKESNDDPGTTTKAPAVPKMTTVVWTSPLGLPVVQPYRLDRDRQIQTFLQTVSLRDHSVPTPVNAQKQSSAFPPNYIHSLDACHMMLSALSCQAVGITFASVHDSYWTHACDVDRMSEILRDCFIKLHSQQPPVLDQLRDEFIERYAAHKIPVLVPLAGEKLQEWNKYLCETNRKPIRGVDAKKISTWVDLEILPLPPKGRFDIRKVRDSPYFFH
ncbi:DNA-directed RNA polymerase [Gaertneriomyces sp. JEL0708]|nr:DNA-directed RNA polymerase [Gaertneriomyces sp. JEL0708]